MDGEPWVDVPPPPLAIVESPARYTVGVARFSMTLSAGTAIETPASAAESGM